MGGEWWGGRLLQLFFIYRAGTKDKWILVFRTLKEIVKKRFFAMIVKSQCAKSLNVRNNAKIVVIIIMGRRKKRDSEHPKHMAEFERRGKKTNIFTDANL